jgi:nitrate/nitrite transport system ATP-binding protein
MPQSLSTTDRRYVEIFNLSKAYPNPYGEAVRVIDGFNLVLRKGEVVSVIGHSGCGKSTVLTMLAGLNEASGGSIAVAGREISGPGPDRAVVFQAPCLLPWMTSLQNVLLGVDRVYPHGTKNERRQIAEYYLAAVGLADSLHKFPREMSGGMQQRVGIARAIALKPRVLLLDEPFGRLDSLTRMDLQEVILRVLDREHITTLLITHDIDEAIYMSDRVCAMTSGPHAHVGKLFDIPFARPRERAEVLEHPGYYALRGELVSFLEEQEHGATSPKTPRDASWDDTMHLVEAMSATQYDVPAFQGAVIENHLNGDGCGHEERRTQRV